MTADRPHADEAIDAPAALTSPATTPRLNPVAGTERVEIIDVLRGLALFGILLANLRGFASPAEAYFVPDLYWHGLGDRLAQAFIDTFVQQKFITIFAFLFGVGFSAQLQRAAARGTAFFRLYARRLVVLAVFGLLHGLFLWFGDILLMYAILGFVLYFFRHRGDVTLIAWAVIGMLIPIGLVAMVSAVVMMGIPIPAMPQPSPEELAAVTATFADGTWSEIHQQRLADLAKNWGKLPFYGSHALGLFLLGMLAGRRGFFVPSPERMPAYRRAMVWGLTVGALGNIAATWLRWRFDLNPFEPGGLMLAVTLIQAVAVPALSLGYACAVIVAWQDPEWRRRLAPFRAVGRTALSNYILQSVLGTFIFYSYGLGLFGTMGPAILLGLGVPLFATQVVASNWWMRRFRFGPLEWVWRSLTYMRVQPWRR